MPVTDKRRLLWLELLGGAVVSALAYVFHFIYQWTGGNELVGLFSATNESVFEHTKILFFPYLLYAIVEYFLLKPNLVRFVAVKAMTAVLLVVLVISVFYTYTGIIGHHITLLDMLLTFAYAFLAAFLSYRLLLSKLSVEQMIFWSLPLFLFVLTAIIYFSLYPLHIPLFYDTQNALYGMQKL